MKKILYIVGTVLIVGMIISALFNRKPNESSVSNSTNSIPSPHYVNVSFNQYLSGRDFTIKLVMEFPNLERCESQLKTNNTSNLLSSFAKQCESDSNCKAYRISSCTTYTDDKYKEMLNKTYSGSHYIHISDRKNTNERGVLVYWGLNESEAQNFCKFMSNKTKSTFDTITTCM